MGVRSLHEEYIIEDFSTSHGHCIINVVFLIFRIWARFFFGFFSSGGFNILVCDTYLEHVSGRVHIKGI